MKDHAVSSARLAGLFVALMLIVAPEAVEAAQGGVPGRPGAEVMQARHHDKSRPLREIPPAPAKNEREAEKRVKELPLFMGGMFDPVVQVSKGAAQAPTLGAGFEGVGQGFSGPNGTFTVNSAPPDTNGAVGPNHFVQIVNQSFAIFDKGGTPVYGPVPTNTLFSGFGGGCQANDDGDATVEYDRLANRWVISQFSVTNARTYHYLQCVAVSTGPNPTGSYYRYAFDYGTTAFPDYPKLGVWPDAYYTTFNIFNNGSAFAGPKVCAYDRTRMQAGLSATQQCFQLSTAYGGLLPSDLDGPTAPPAGSPNYIMDFGTNQLELWKFHVDWTTPANSTFSGAPTAIPVAGFTAACNGGGGVCIPQPGTSQQLDSLGDRLMYRLAYRNFGDHESLVVNQSVTAGTTTGVRWYELRDPSAASPVVYQQGTYAPDATHRWMGSAAMDRAGGIGLGFSASSSTVRPSLRFTGRVASDPLNTMGQGEATLIAGTGSQLTGLSRWGDYSSLGVDPVDDCTFWFTSEYLASSGTFNWHTRIGTFQLPGCAAAVTPDFAISATPASQTVAPGSGTSYTTNVTPTGGFGGNVDLTVSGLPSGATGSFTPATVSGGGTSTLAVTTTSSVAPGSYPLTITGTSGAQVHTAQVTLVIANPAPAPDFTLTVTPATGTVSRGQRTTFTVTAAPSSSLTGGVSLSASGLPSRASASFSPNPTTSTSTMTVTTNKRTPTGTSTVTVTGTGGGVTHTQTVTLTVR
ncbi:MAG: hypothetical protein E6G41_04345 [Actinobacteria bacterium]|nr:MAG: hypothetical protein E6G41_04345 [Actinomycetota bacterium]